MNWEIENALSRLEMHRYEGTSRRPIDDAAFISGKFQEMELKIKQLSLLVDQTHHDSPPADDAASQYREAYYAGMADGPVPGTD